MLRWFQGQLERRRMKWDFRSPPSAACALCAWQREEKMGPSRTLPDVPLVLQGHQAEEERSDVIRRRDGDGLLPVGLLDACREAGTRLAASELLVGNDCGYGLSVTVAEG